MLSKCIQRKQNIAEIRILWFKLVKCSSKSQLLNSIKLWLLISILTFFLIIVGKCGKPNSLTAEFLRGTSRADCFWWYDLFEYYLVSKRLRINQKCMPTTFSLFASIKAKFMKARVVKRRILLHKQGRLTCPQFSTFLYAYKSAPIILKIKGKVLTRVFWLIM